MTTGWRTPWSTTRTSLRPLRRETPTPSRPGYVSMPLTSPSTLGSTSRTSSRPTGAGSAAAARGFSYATGPDVLPPSPVPVWAGRPARAEPVADSRTRADEQQPCPPASRGRAGSGRAGRPQRRDRPAIHGRAEHLCSPVRFLGRPLRVAPRLLRAARHLLPGARGRWRRNGEREVRRARHPDLRARGRAGPYG